MALYEVYKATSEYNYRKICRWYSREFHTPLDYVEMDLPKEKILMHYFECMIEKSLAAAQQDEMSANQWERLKKMILEPEAFEKEESSKEADDDEFLRQLKADLENETVKDSENFMLEPPIASGGEDL